MSLIKLKTTVKVPKVVVISCAVVNAANTLGLPDMLITSGNDGTHMPGSKHYYDHALDIRTKQLSMSQKVALVAEVRRRLGKDYDLILENLGKAQEHLHIEYDPK